MSVMDWLTVFGNGAAVATFLIAAFAYFHYRLDRWRKRRKVENYLKAEKEEAKDRGQRSVLHLMAKLGLTEAEILNASSQSSHIARRIATDPETNRAEALLFEYR